MVIRRAHLNEYPQVIVEENVVELRKQESKIDHTQDHQEQSEEHQSGERPEVSSGKQARKAYSRRTAGFFAPEFCLASLLN